MMMQGGKNMSLETSKKVLKISGILTVIFAVLAIIAGIALLGFGSVIAVDEEIQAMEGAAEGVFGAYLIGILCLVSGTISLIEGVVSVKASKNTKYGTAAFIFAIFGLLGSISSVITSFKNNGNASGFVSAFLTIALSVLILVAANNVRQAHKGGQ